MHVREVVGSRALRFVVVLMGSSLLTAMPALADPVGECQAATGNQVEASQCLRDTLGAAEQVMGLELDRAQKKADSLDQVTGRMEARPTLDQSQSEWEKFRDVNCSVRFAFAAGASGAGQFQTSCAIEMTRARAQELAALATGA
jgi:uncharacterized protein YecT (DUF1311 family)